MNSEGMPRTLPSLLITVQSLSPNEANLQPGLNHALRLFDCYDKLATQLSCHSCSNLEGEPTKLGVLQL